MEADELIKRLRGWVSTVPGSTGESILHAETLAVLKRWGAGPISEYFIENGTLGRSRIDLYVPCGVEHLLIEIKESGDWRRVAEATWQLFQASALLAGQGVATKRLVVCGSPLIDPNQPAFLRVNDVAWATAGKALEA